MTNKDDGNEFFNQTCSQDFNFVDVPKKSMNRQGAKGSDHQRMLKVCFRESYDKCKSLANKPKFNKKFEHLKIVCDVCEDNRLENKNF